MTTPTTRKHAFLDDFLCWMAQSLFCCMSYCLGIGFVMCAGADPGGGMGAVAPPPPLPPLHAAADDVMRVSCTQLLRAPRSARGTQTLTVRGLRLLKGQGQRAKKARCSEHAPPSCACADTGRRGVSPPLQSPGSAPGVYIRFLCTYYVCCIPCILIFEFVSLSLCVFYRSDLH